MPYIIILNPIQFIITIFYICKLSNLCLTPIWELHATLLYLVSPYTLLALMIPLPIPPITTLPIITLIYYNDLMEDIFILLKIDYVSWFTISLNFPSLFDTKINYLVISLYQIHMKIIINKIKTLYNYCCLFMFIDKSWTLNIDNKLMLQSLLSDFIILLDLDSCDIIDRKYRFYK